MSNDTSQFNFIIIVFVSQWTAMDKLSVLQVTEICELPELHVWFIWVVTSLLEGMTNSQLTETKQRLSCTNLFCQSKQKKTKMNWRSWDSACRELTYLCVCLFVCLFVESRGSLNMWSPMRGCSASAHRKLIFYTLCPPRSDATVHVRGEIQTRHTTRTA